MSREEPLRLRRQSAHIAPPERRASASLHPCASASRYEVQEAKGGAAVTERERLIDALADCVVGATEYGEQEGGFVAFYLSPTGPIHRAIVLLNDLGVTVRPGIDGRQP